MKKVNILGVKIDSCLKKEVLDKILALVKKRKRAQIATVNPEFIIEANKNRRFKQVLSKTKISVADGIGIRAAAKFFALPKANNKLLRSIQTFFQGFFLIGPAVICCPSYFNIIPQTITGVNLSLSLARLAAQNNLSIFLLGGQPGVAKAAAKKLKNKYNLKVAGTYSGSPDKKEESKIVNKINKSNPDILLVAYGAPAQDLWIKRNLDKFKRPLIAMGVGGTLDFIAGFRNLNDKRKIKRAPAWMRKLNLEWLFRLFQEPKKRAKRIYRAVVVFPWLVWKNALTKEVDS